MKRLTSLLALALFCFSLAAQTPDPAKIANIEEIFAITKADQMQQQVFSQLEAMAAAQLQKTPGYVQNPDALREMNQRLFQILTQRMNWGKIKPSFVTLYDETFSASEISGMLAFYKTPAGAAMLSKMPVLMSKTMTLAQALMADAMPDVQRTVEEFIAKSKSTQPARDNKQ